MSHLEPPQAFLLSRYNLHNSKLRGRLGLDDHDTYLAWCTSRAKLFLEKTLPSVLAQTDDAFTWLIYFDPELNAPVENVLRAIDQYENIEAMFHDSRPGAAECTLAEAMSLHVSDRRGEPHGVTTTTRLDTDDALHRDFFKQMRKVASRISISTVRARPVAIAFPFGAQEVDGRFFAHHQNANAFITLVEASDAAPKTVFSGNHSNVRRFASLKTVTYSQPLWLQVIHASNAGNFPKSDLLELGPRQILLHAFGRA